MLCIYKGSLSLLFDCVITIGEGELEEVLSENLIHIISIKNEGDVAYKHQQHLFRKMPQDILVLSDTQCEMVVKTLPESVIETYYTQPPKR
jgi:pantothenate kinase